MCHFFLSFFLFFFCQISSSEFLEIVDPHLSEADFAAIPDVAVGNEDLEDEGGEEEEEERELMIDDGINRSSSSSKVNTSKKGEKRGEGVQKTIIFFGFQTQLLQIYLEK